MSRNFIITPRLGSRQFRTSIGLKLINYDCSFYNQTNLTEHNFQGEESRRRKSIQKLLQLGKNKTLEQMNNLHKRILKDSLHKNKLLIGSLFLTESSNNQPGKEVIPIHKSLYEKKSKSNSHGESIRLNTQESSRAELILHPSSRNDDSDRKLHMTFFQTLNVGTSTLVQTGGNFPRETVSQFIGKSREISKNLFLKKIKTETIYQNDEIYNNAIEKLKNKMKVLGEVAALKKKYDNSFLKYCKSLKAEVELQREELKKLIVERTKLDTGNKKIVQTIEKTKRELEILKEYKHFLLQCKFKKLSLRDIPLKVLESYGIELEKAKEKKRLKESITKRPSIFFKKSIDRRNSIFMKTKTNPRKMSTLTNDEDDDEHKHEHDPFNPIIFSSIEEFEKNFQSMKDEDMLLLNQLDNLQRSIRPSNKTRNNFHKQAAEYEDKYKEYINKQENELAKVKNKHQMLLNERKLLQEIYDVDNKGHKFFSIFYKKLRNIIFNLPIQDSLKRFDKDIDGPRGIISLLEILERLLFDYGGKKVEYEKSEKQSVLHKFENEQILKKMRENIIKSRQLDQTNREKVSQDVLRKIHKLVILPKRKVGESIFFQKKKKPQVKEESNDNDEFMHYATYN